MKAIFVIACIFLAMLSIAQPGLSGMQKGNELYIKGEYDKSIQQYQKALKGKYRNAALFNIGNAYFRKKDFAKAEQYFAEASAQQKKAASLSESYYNRGLTQVKQKKLKEAINSFRQALKLNPADNDARENLQKAINELKKQQENKENQQNKNQRQEEQKKKKRDEKPIEKQQAEDLFRQLQQNERSLKQLLQKQKSPPSNLEKDW